MNSVKQANRRKWLGKESSQNILKNNREIQHNLQYFGIPYLVGAYGCGRKSQLIEKLQKLLYEELSDQLVEITIRPEDPDGHHWMIEYHVLAAGPNGRFVRAFELGRKR